MPPSYRAACIAYLVSAVIGLICWVLMVIIGMLWANLLGGGIVFGAFIWVLVMLVLFCFARSFAEGDRGPRIGFAVYGTFYTVIGLLALSSNSNGSPFLVLLWVVSSAAGVVCSFLPSSNEYVARERP